MIKNSYIGQVEFNVNKQLRTYLGLHELLPNEFIQKAIKPFVQTKLSHACARLHETCHWSQAEYTAWLQDCVCNELNSLLHGHSPLLVGFTVTRKKYQLRIQYRCTAYDEVQELVLEVHPRTRAQTTQEYEFAKACFDKITGDTDE